MKRRLLSLFAFFLSCSISMSAQYGYNAVGMGAVDYIEVPDDPDGSLDVPGAFTFEAWIFNAGGTSNQKVGGKLAADFVNGFIFGIEDQQVNMEVFDESGNNTSLKTGFISAIGWTHVAGAYEVGGMLSIFVNGEKMGETPASNEATDFNTNPFRIGIAPWDVNALGFVGYIDEVRYWQMALDEETIRAWMHQDVTDDHPNYDALTLYHKYNEPGGADLLLDDSGNGNDGTFSATGGQSLEPFFLPFKGDFELFENDVQGAWNAKPVGNSDIFEVELILLDSLEPEQSVVLSHSGGDYDYDDVPINNYFPLLRHWRIATQGDFLVNMTFDLSDVPVVTQAIDVVLLSDDEPDFSGADVISGEFQNNVLTIEEEALTDGNYYTLGLSIFTPTDESFLNESSIQISPNPSPGIFSLTFEQPIEEATASISNLHGKKIGQSKLAAGQTRFELDLSAELNSGLYFLEIKNGEGASVVKKLVVD